MLSLSGRSSQPCFPQTSGAANVVAIAPVTTSQLANGLRLYRIALEGTRAVTILVGFDAGSRSECAEENGIAHFLEHLVFKGGEKYPSVRDVQRRSERLGARMNAFTSQDLVAFHITVRAERALEAADLLTDFTARPQIDAAELDKERGVVIQEIARSHDQPSALADELIDAAAFGEHPLGRSILGTEERLRSFGRDQVLAFRARRWAGERGGAFLVGNLSALGDDGALEELLSRFPAIEVDGAVEPAPPPAPQILVEPRDSKQSHLRLGYRPPIDVSDPRERAALSIYATLLGGSMGSRLVDEIREQRGLAYLVRASDYPTSDAVLLQLEAGLESSNCVEAYRRMREIVAELAAEGPTEEEVERARAFASGRRVLALESTSAVARHAARQTITYDDAADPDEEIARLDAVTDDDVAALARRVADRPAVACVGPHTAEEFA